MSVWLTRSIESNGAIRIAPKPVGHDLFSLSGVDDLISVLALIPPVEFSKIYSFISESSLFPKCFFIGQYLPDGRSADFLSSRIYLINSDASVEDECARNPQNNKREIVFWKQGITIRGISFQFYVYETTTSSLIFSRDRNIAKEFSVFDEFEKRLPVISGKIVSELETRRCSIRVQYI